MAYIRGKGVLVGVYTFAEVRAGKHLEAIQNAKKETGLQHEYRDYWCDCCVPVGYKIYLVAECDRRD